MGDYTVIEKPDHHMCSDCGGNVILKLYDDETELVCSDCEAELNVFNEV